MNGDLYSDGNGTRGVDYLVGISMVWTGEILDIARINLKYTVDNYENNLRSMEYNKNILETLRDINDKLQTIIDKK